MAKSPGDSSEQREAEAWLMDALSQKLGVRLVKRRWSLGEGSWIELDGFCESPMILCEAWAHIGTPKSAQKNKVMTDAFKLLFVKALLKGNGKCILLFADRDAAAHFQGKSWMAQCLREYDITVEVIELPPEVKDKVLKAQKRQYR
jgi:hypothetical protein